MRHNKTRRALKPVPVTTQLEMLTTYYAFHEHVLLCGDALSLDECSCADLHWTHAKQLVSTPADKHDRLFARHAKAVLLDRAAQHG